MQCAHEPGQKALEKGTALLKGPANGAQQVGCRHQPDAKSLWVTPSLGWEVIKHGMNVFQQPWFLQAFMCTISQHPGWDRALAFPLVPAALLRCGDVISSQVLVQLQEPPHF